MITSIVLILIAIELKTQSVEPIQVEWNGKLYWKYELVDQNNNTPFKYYYQYDSKGRFLAKNLEFPRNGSWISFFREDTMQVASIFKIKDNLLNGKSIQFYLNGSKQSEYDFHDREPIKFVRYWNEQEILVSEDQYKYDEDLERSVKVGQWKKWDDEGKLTKLNSYAEDELNGIQLEFYVNGQVKVEEFYVQGVRDSSLTNFHLNGRISNQRRYSRGEFIEENPYTDYHENGSIFGTGDLENGLEKGKWIYYYKTGLKEPEGKYRIHITPHEHRILYYSIKEGNWNYWYENGEIRAQGAYTEDVIEAILYGNEPNSLSIQKGNWRFYNKDGEEISHEEFIAQEDRIMDL